MEEICCNSAQKLLPVRLLCIANSVYDTLCQYSNDNTRPGETILRHLSIFSMQERVNTLQVKSALSNKKRTERPVKCVPGTFRVKSQDADQFYCGILHCHKRRVRCGKLLLHFHSCTHLGCSSFKRTVPVLFFFKQITQQMSC